MFTCPEQLSVAVTFPIPEGTSSHDTVPSTGRVINVGGVMSLTVIRCVLVAVLPQLSVAVHRLMIS